MKSIKSIVQSVLGIAATTSMLTTSIQADQYDLSNPEDALAVNRKVQCSTIDSKPVFYTWEGYALGRRMGEADKRLFKVMGMNVRQCGSLDGGKKGKGYRMVTREIMLYLDMKTGKPLDKWQNPYTGKEVDVIHVANDPVNSRPSYPYNAKGEPAYRFFGRFQENNWFMTFPVPLFYHNVLAGEYQKYVGNAYHATEMFNFMGEKDSLLDKSTDTDMGAKVGWVRLSTWLPWMEMQGREGIIYFQAAGGKVSGFEGLPKVMQDYINKVEPAYKAPPPLDDDRENETSWTYFKKKLVGGKLKRGGH
ncbi:DUF1838 family protein [Temperatibacter marinus]|uniref:DUF1838 family protein n=1 Tax=Temperatibacter marinus TaxID=1456591 RepID=A0AA52HBC3_9PROT|nr:DUF1838 family protein [Temperatibacter marinus]WND03488.1 DUF1838 family protein [Temperatibacter marinus]